MFSQSKIAFLFVAAVAVVQGFAPVAQPRFASNTELGAFFQKTAEKSPTLSVEPETKKNNPFSKFGKKAAAPVEEKAAPAKKFSFGKKTVAATKAPAVKKAVAKKAAKKVVKKVIAKKAPAVKKVAVKKAPVVKKVVAKKAPVVKKVVAKRKLVAKKPATKSSFKNDFKIQKPNNKKKGLTIYERQCHIN